MELDIAELRRMTNALRLGRRFALPDTDQPYRPASPHPLQCLRTLAGRWHSGSRSPLYAFASTGRLHHTPTLDRDTYLGEIAHARADLEGLPAAYRDPVLARAQLDLLHEFFSTHAINAPAPHLDPDRTTLYRPGTGQWGVFDVDEGLLRIAPTWSQARDWAIDHTGISVDWERHHTKGTKAYEYVFLCDGEAVANLHIVALDHAPMHGFPTAEAPAYPYADDPHEEPHDPDA